MHQRLGANQQRPLDETGLKQQTQGQDALHGLSQTHLVGQERPIPRHQKGDPFHLVRIGLERQPHLLAGEEILQGRLQKIEKPFFEHDRVRRRPKARSPLRARRSAGKRRCFRNRGREWLSFPGDASVLCIPGHRKTPAFGRDVERQLSQGAHPRRAVQQPELAHASLQRTLEARVPLRVKQAAESD